MPPCNSPKTKDGKNKSSGFKQENELLNAILASNYMREMLKSDEQAACLVEPKGPTGIPDLVVVIIDPNDRRLLRSTAFELKLSNWKQALIQAYRYRAFTTTAYVVLDEQYVHRAKAKMELFQKSKIGLLSIDLDGHVTTHFDPEPTAPYSDSLEQEFEKTISLILDKEARINTLFLR